VVEFNEERTMTYANPEYLISTDQLSQLIDDNSETLRIFDTTVFLHPDPPRFRVESGAEQYRAAHIPGAGFLDLTDSLSNTDSPYGFTLPAPDTLAEAFEDAGIRDDTQVVLYSGGHLMWATRVWWMLHSLGHTAVSVLDGGIRTWREEGRAVEDGLCSYPTGVSGKLTQRFDPSAWADSTAVLGAIGDSSICTVNALSEDVYSGAGPMNYGRKGHIAGSRSVPYETLLEKGKFHAAEHLSETLSAKGLLNAERVICYCGGGISATIDAFALRLLGHTGVAVYDGSMSEWTANAELPMETGPDTSD
jgi:thiosulfate/3-mercaptopyruvate sulfurtransferase